MFVVDYCVTMAINKDLPQNQFKKKLYPARRYPCKKIKTNRRKSADKQLYVQFDFGRFQYLCTVVYCLLFVTRNLLRFTLEYTF